MYFNKWKIHTHTHTHPGARSGFLLLADAGTLALMPSEVLSLSPMSSSCLEIYYIERPPEMKGTNIIVWQPAAGPYTFQGPSALYVSCEKVSNDKQTGKPSVTPEMPSRLARGADDKKNTDLYIARSRKKVIAEAAAEAWAAGVEWDDALNLATRAVDKVKLMMQPVGKAKAKAKARM